MSRENAKEEFPVRIRFARWLGHQRWIPKGQDALLRAVLNPDAGYDFPFEVDFFGYRYRGNTKNFLDWTVLLYGAYTPSELSCLDHVARYLRRQGRRVVYLDIGANIGHHILFMSGLADKIYGFHPNRAVLKHAREKIAMNSITNTALYEIALGARNETRAYFPPGGANEMTGSFCPGWSGNSRASIPPIHLARAIYGGVERTSGL